MILASLLLAAPLYLPPPTLPPPTTTAPVVTTTTTRPVPVTVPKPTGCAGALADVQASGLTIPAGWAFTCPAPAYAYGAEHFGRTCMDPCYGAPAKSIEVNAALAPPSRLRGVIGHELCHAWEYQQTGTSSEASADACTARFGFPNA